MFSKDILFFWGGVFVIIIRTNRGFFLCIRFVVRFVLIRGLGRVSLLVRTLHLLSPALP